MILKQYSGWIFNNTVYWSFSIANKLWKFTRQVPTQESAHHLFFIGWYDRPNDPSKLYTIIILWFEIKIGWNKL